MITGVNELVEGVIDIDTTGSMRPCRREVLVRVEELFTKLFKEIPNLRVGLGAHGDYCDKDRTYVTIQHDLTTNIYDLCQFLRNLKDNDGGEAEECYELVLQKARSYNWSFNCLIVNF